MPVDLWDAATWPSPSPEAEVRARVRARVRTLRRRRSLPALAAASALVVAVAVWPRPSAQTGLATEGSTEEATAIIDDAHDHGEHGEAAVPTAPAASRRTGAAMPPRVDPSEPGVPALPTSFPATPTYSSGHPVLRDAVGDGVVETAPARWEHDPTVDIVDLDVTADDEAVTVELRLGDLSAAPMSSFTRGRPTAHDYQVGLRRARDYFILTLQRDASGRVSVTAGYWSAHGEMGLVDTSGGTMVEGVTGTVDTARDRVRLTAPYRALNEAVTRHSQVHPGAHEPVGLGTTVMPTGSTTARYQGTYHDAPDRIESNDPNFVHRLGD